MLSKGCTIERICKQCGAYFLARPDFVEKGGAKFCSRQCWWQSSQGKAAQAEGRVSLKRPRKVERTCETCGKIFYTTPFHIRNGHGRFCSVKCWWNSPEGKTSQKCERTPEWRRRIAEGLSKYMRKMWQDPEFVAKMNASLAKRPTEPEQQLIGILSKNFPQFRYNGDCSLGIVLAGLIPDFVNVDGKKEIIEVFGDYWHSDKKKHYRELSWHQTELGRTMAYNSVGYKTLVIWEHDLNNKSEDEIINMIKAFIGKEDKCQL